MKGQRGEDAGFLSSVVPFNISGGVGFCIPKLGGLSESRLKTQTVGIHPIQNEVGRAVDNAHDFVDFVAGKRIAKRANDRNRSGNSRFVIQLRSHAGSSIKKLGAVLGQQRLIRGHHVGTRTQGLEDQCARWLNATHQLDHDVGLNDEGLRVGRQQIFRDGGRANRVKVANGNTNQ